jgi:hypothetical protein
MTKQSIVQQIVSAEVATENSAGLMAAAFARFVSFLATFTTGEAWDAGRAEFVAEYNTVKGYAADSAAGGSAWDRLTKRAKADASIRKPQTEKAKSAQADRQARAENVSIAMLTSPAVPLADREAEVTRLEKASKSSDPVRAAQATAILANVADAAMAVKTSGIKLRELREACHAFALVDTLCGLTKAQKAKHDECKAAIVVL